MLVAETVIFKYGKQAPQLYMKAHMPLILIALLFIGACKKDTTPQAQISFAINGTTKTFAIYTSTLSTYDTLGVQQKTLALASAGVLSGPALSSGVVVAVNQTLNLPGASGLNTGLYRDAAFNTNCAGSTYNAGCTGFYFNYYDPTLGRLNLSTTDTTGTLSITAFSASASTVSGVFSGQVADNNGLLYQVTSGEFINVPFVNQ